MKELIRKILSEETKPGKYIGMIEDLTEYFKNEDCVCDIKIEHKPEEFRDSYLITVVLGNKDLDDKFNGISWQISDYRTKLKRRITKEVLDFLPIPFYIEFRQTPKCYKDLQESENKKSSLLMAIEEDGLYQVMQDTGLSMGQIILKYDNLPREVFERYIKDFIKHDGYHQTDGSVQLGYEVEIQTHVYTEHFYMKGDRVTVEIRRFDNRGQQTEGYIESLSNLTDDEIFNIVDDMTSWGGDIDYEI